MTVHHLIVTYGYIAVFVLVGAESLGVPLPGETTLVAAAGYAGSTHKLSVWAIFAVAATAAIVGDTTGYWIGDKGGYRLLYRYGRYVRLDEPKIKVARYLFDHHGGAVVFFGRFVSILRTYAAFLAGTTKMRYRRFLAFNASGGILWAAVYTFLAYYAGSFLARASTTVDLAFAGIGVLAIVAGIVFVRRHLGSLVEKAEAEYPGPLARPGERQHDDVGDAGNPEASNWKRDRAATRDHAATDEAGASGATVAGAGHADADSEVRDRRAGPATGTQGRGSEALGPAPAAPAPVPRRPQA